ncbi:MAG: hypothetical protein ACRC33_07750 [Gemmataceae bacterium]
MSALVVLACLAQGDVAPARAVLADLVRAARDNQRARVPLRGDELADALVRAAARSAERQPEKERAKAFLLAVGVGLDSSSLMRRSPLVGPTWVAVETDRERDARLKVLGTPTLFGRHDLAQHFAVSAALTAARGAKAAEAFGVAKEFLDAQPGGSEFSFADLAADFGGVALAEAVMKDPGRLKAVGKLADHALPPEGLPEGLDAEQFEARYGGVKDRRFAEACDRLKQRLRGRPGFAG